MSTGPASRASVLTSALPETRVWRKSTAFLHHARSSKRAGDFINRIALDQCRDPERYRTRAPILPVATICWPISKIGANFRECMITYMAEFLEKVDNRPGTWNSTVVGVFRCEGENKEQVGQYKRNYPSLFRTFCHFRKGDKDYALYAPDYTASRIMELPSCKDIGGEESHGAGFCPVDYYVPRYIERESIGLDDKVRRYRINEPAASDLVAQTTKFTPLDEKTGQRIAVEKPSYPVSPLLYYPFGFVAGCIWGDDSSWKIQYLDLTNAENGVLQRDERFGYIALPDSMQLSQAVDVVDYQWDAKEESAHHITIAIEKRFDLRTGKPVDELL